MYLTKLKTTARLTADHQAELHPTPIATGVDGSHAVQIDIRSEAGTWLGTLIVPNGDFLHNISRTIEAAKAAVASGEIER